jgi:hypothetical protein
MIGKKTVPMTTFIGTVVGRHRLRKIRKMAQRKEPGTLVLLLAAVRSVPASKCALPAKDADTVVLRATRYTDVKGTRNSVLFGVQKGNAQQRKVRAWELEL